MTLEYYNDDEMYRLHLEDRCPYGCPFCFDEEDEEIEEEKYKEDYEVR